jgi:hypothetical protein
MALGPPPKIIISGAAAAFAAAAAAADAAAVAASPPAVAHNSVAKSTLSFISISSMSPSIVNRYGKSRTVPLRKGIKTLENAKNSIDSLIHNVTIALTYDNNP